ncbi:class I SAM-dependent methyltransferase [Sneathiella litorea]|uniref:Class I SAM-dependent methyltransferase n=1 Tax=Sneathiella litorea TaxID=2606216 RepID=A0A6L8W9K7_9PROT|nr:class I SAM-dependent methyltransferase [Sneathiella litorea]MZR31070.1 class I SAM-dependent methyltransferase [Sneathiella litorea]
MAALPNRERSPVFAAIAIQLVVFGGIYLLRSPLEGVLDYPVPLLWLSLSQGLIAGIITRGFGFSAPWVIGQVIAPPLLLFALALNLPSWIFPVILVLLVLVFWNVAVGRVPLFLTNRTTSEAILKLLPKKKGLHVTDLGSGLGGTLRYLAQKMPDARFTGLETAPLPFALSWMIGKIVGGRNLDYRFRDIFREDLSGYDVIYCFLSPVPMPRLYEKAKKEMKPGSLFISNSFEVPGHRPDKIIKVADRRQTKLLIWRM